ncbi:MAG: hypothetical protein DRH33_00530 [Candidatus Nealsonbacteria bacterium]|nr:MAG: hypothetical protein DRH33_00530 [Candidatus Nealsonbacteria bacterium]
MLKKISLVLILSILLWIFVFPQFIFAQEILETPWPLKKKEVENLLDIIKEEPLAKAHENFFSRTISGYEPDSPRKTGAVVLVKQVILKKQLDYWFKEAPKEFSKKFLKVALEVGLTIATKGTYGAYDIINQIEKFTVKKANEYALNWFLQNEIKIGSGEVSYTFTSYKGNKQQLNIQYIIEYAPLNQSQGKIITEFYSKNPIEPPENRGTIGYFGNNFDWITSTCWPHDWWLDHEKQRDNDGKLEPFIVRVKGDVRRNKWGNFKWDYTKPPPLVEVDFDNPVPEIEQSDIILEKGETAMKWEYFKEKFFKPLLEKTNQTKSFLSEKGKIVKDITADLIEKIKDYISSLKLGAKIVTEETSETPLSSLSSVSSFRKQNLEKLTEEVLQLEESGETLEESTEKEKNP